jgi:hypothetical protein
MSAIDCFLCLSIECNSADVFVSKKCSEGFINIPTQKIKMVTRTKNPSVVEFAHDLEGMMVNDPGLAALDLLVADEPNPRLKEWDTVCSLGFELMAREAKDLGFVEPPREYDHRRLLLRRDGANASVLDLNARDFDNAITLYHRRWKLGFTRAAHGGAPHGSEEDYGLPVVLFLVGGILISAVLLIPSIASRVGETHTLFNIPKAAKIAVVAGGGVSAFVGPLSVFTILQDYGARRPGDTVYHGEAAINMMYR